MDNSRKKPHTLGNAPQAAAERRRIARIVHDERGNATVDWCDAPADYQRTKLEIADDLALSIEKPPQTFNPYERSTVRDPKTSNTTRKDLRKLSEWIKQMRELEESKRKEDGEE
ncbi:MAG: hypothetical protein JWM63_3046 [Gammaproteobacteria bacterium]|jgi:hypothetical protein|nr:hypothetical protein [Gammaproteobacteria bacterium]